MSAEPQAAPRPWYRSRRVWLQLTVSLVVTVGLLYALVGSLQEGVVQVMAPGFEPRFLLLALGAYTVATLCRAVRFQHIHRELPGSTTAQWLQVAVIHAGLNQVLPFRSGETSYPYLMHRIHGVTVGRSLLVLLSARILDLMANFLYAIPFVLLLAAGQLHTSRTLFVAVAGAVVLVCLLALVALRPAARFFYRLSRPRAGGAPCGRLRAAVHQRAARLVAEARMFHGPRHFAVIFLLSAGLWLSLFLTFWGLMNGFGFAVPLPAAVIGTVGAAMMNVLPVSGIANFGTQEAGWTLGLMLAGLSRETGFAAGFWTHVGTMALAVLFALLGFAWMKASARKRP